MGVGVPELIICALVGYLWYNSWKKGKTDAPKIPKGKWDTTKKQIKEIIYDVKDMEFEVKETINDVEQQIKQKHRSNDKKDKEETSKAIKE